MDTEVVQLEYLLVAYFIGSRNPDTDTIGVTVTGNLVQCQGIFTERL